MSNETTPPTAVARFDKAKSFLERADFKQQIARALPKHLTADRMLRVALTAVTRTPKLAECDLASIAQALLTASQLGLEVDGKNGHLVPYNNKGKMTCQFIPGYQGLIQLAYNHPKVKSIWWGVVHDKDKFTYKRGLDFTLEHEDYQGDDDPGPLKFAYAICQLEGGGKTFVVLNRRMVEKAKTSSRSAASSFSPWSTHAEAMWAKTAVRSLAKQIPQSNELRLALEKDDELDGLIDRMEERFNPQKAQITPPLTDALMAGFAGETNDMINEPPAEEKN